MESRTEKYSSETTRSSKNKNLYKDLYKDTNYSNMVVIDDSNEIDIDKIKQILDKEKKPSRNTSDFEPLDSLKAYYGIDEEEESPKKKYDINEVLKEAKNKRNIIEEANEKRKIENYKFKNNLSLENELAKTRKVYNDLVKEETELLNIMNTLTNIDIDSKNNINNTASMALDLLNTISDKEKDIVDEKMDEVNEKVNKALNVKKVDEKSKEYSTDTFMFETKDFEGLKSVKENLKKNNKLMLALIFVFTVIVVIACYYLIVKLIIK